MMRYKPPAKVDGLVHFSSDVASPRFTDQERRAMIESESGRKIAEALSRCSKIKQDLTNARESWTKDKENKEKKVKVEIERNKYLECLAFVSCKERWIQYRDCWRNLNMLSQKDLQRLNDIGVAPCPYERNALEQCVGRLVSSTVRVAGEVSDKEALFDETSAYSGDLEVNNITF